MLEARIVEESALQHSDQAVLVALGSNLSGSFETTQALLEAALAAFEPAGLHILARSRWWRSAAWPDPHDPPYLNGVAVIETSHSLEGTLAALHEIEARFGRLRHVANAPRTLDLDLIAYGRAVVEDAAVTVPHPRAAERLFVMGPLAEIAPDWMHPSLGLTAAELAARATVGVDATPCSTLANTPRS
jgi:2-amino-4-hydroxy-6-hydroxymethyldihydropteridine diphosphokinase